MGMSPSYRAILHAGRDGFSMGDVTSEMRVPTLEKIIYNCSLYRTSYNHSHANAAQMRKFPKHYPNNFSKFSHEN